MCTVSEKAQGLARKFLITNLDWHVAAVKSLMLCFNSAPLPCLFLLLGFRFFPPAFCLPPFSSLQPLIDQIVVWLMKHFPPVTKIQTMETTLSYFNPHLQKVCFRRQLLHLLWTYESIINSLSAALVDSLHLHGDREFIVNSIFYTPHCIELLLQ